MIIIDMIKHITYYIKEAFYIPDNATRLVKEFIKQHRARLLSMWKDQDFEELEFKE